MGNFFAELKHRNIYRVGAAYVVVAWALTQFVEILAEVFALPLLMAQSAIVLLAFGFPVALLIAWSFEKRPHEAIASAIRSKHTTVDWMLFGAVAVLIALTGYQQIARSSITQTPSGVEAAREAAVSSATAISLAVLPFANMSGDATQEFFSDGMTEEITSALSKVPDLRVVARTSAFEFKGRNVNVRAVGQQLGATHLLEGSIRKEGNRLRVTAQLIKTDDGVHIWTDSYDRELTGVFTIQEDIATAIAAALRMPLGLKPGERLVTNRTDDLVSYEQYLRLLALTRARTNFAERNMLIENIIARDPSFAPAWGIQALASAGIAGIEQNLLWTQPIEETRRLVQSRLDKGEVAARKGIELDPRLATGFAALAFIQGQRTNFVTAEDLYRHALALDPNNPEVLHPFSQMLANAGRLKEALRVREMLLTLEPLSPIYNTVTAEVMQLNGQIEPSIRMLESIPITEAVGDYRVQMLARAYAEEGRFGEAADTLLLFPARLPARRSAEDAAKLLRTAPSSVTTPESLPILWERLNFVYSYLGASNRVMEYPERSLQAGIANGAALRLLWHGSNAPVRKTERFKKFVRDDGLVDYWRERGWPDLCHPTTGDDFECE